MNDPKTAEAGTTTPSDHRPGGPEPWRHLGAPGVATTAEVEEALDAGAALAVGVSGGRDSQAAALACLDHLDARAAAGKARGPLVLIHADLGLIEWCDSLATCRRLADATDLELLVSSRKAGGMLERWESRWASSLERYRQASTLRLVMPWSSATSRFCTAELKRDVIESALKKRFRDLRIVSACGIRRDESLARRGKPVASAAGGLTRRGLSGLNWNPIIEWGLADVEARVARAGLALHEAYTAYGSKRVSCSFCILQSIGDQKAAASCAGNAEAYRAVCGLEARSGFAFQSSRWLGDLRPDLLGPGGPEATAAAKAVARAREAAQSRLPAHLALGGRAWPLAVPTREEAAVLADVRAAVCAAHGIEGAILDPEGLRGRYADMLAANAPLAV